MPAMAMSFHVATVICVAPTEAVPSNWRQAFEALGVTVTRALVTAAQSPGILAKLARDRGLNQLCILDADPDGVRLSLYRALPGGHGELLTATMGDAPAGAPPESLTSALALRLELLVTTPQGSGAWVPAPPPKPLPPLPADVALDLTSPTRVPWPELPVVELPTPLTARDASEAPATTDYELTVDYADTPAPPLDAPPKPEAGVVDAYAGLQVTGDPGARWLALGLAVDLRFSPLGRAVPLAPALVAGASPLWLGDRGPAVGPLKVSLSPLVRALHAEMGFDWAVGAQADLWLRRLSAADEGPNATLTVGPSARIGWAPGALGGARWCASAHLALPSGGLGGVAAPGALRPGDWAWSLDAGWPLP